MSRLSEFRDCGRRPDPRPGFRANPDHPPEAEQREQPQRRQPRVWPRRLPVRRHRRRRRRQRPARPRSATRRTPSTLFGKMLRIDISGTTGAVRYRIPPSNPFSSSATLCNTNGTGTQPCPRSSRWIAQSLALELRPRDRAALGRRRRPGCVRGSGPRGPRRQLRLALLRRHAHQHRVPLRDAGETKLAGRAVRPQRRRDRDRRLRLPRHALPRPGRALHLRRLRRPAGSSVSTPPRRACSKWAEDSLSGLSISSFGQGLDGELFAVDYNGGLYHIRQ